MPLYFAYGSNMDVAAMALRCPRSAPEGLARLPRHRFTLMSRGYATVVRDPRSDVWGLLWTLALSDIPALDRWEEVSRGLYAKTQQPVVRKGGAAVQSLIYVAGAEEVPGPMASCAYGEGVIRAAREAGVPVAYADPLQKLFAARAPIR